VVQLHADGASARPAVLGQEAGQEHLRSRPMAKA
jgi:hypothetical protein